MLFPVCFPVMINSKTLKTKRAKVFVFKGSKEARNWGRQHSRGWGQQLQGMEWVERAE